MQYETIGSVNFPYPAEKTTISVKMSGGMDSATLLYVLGWLQYHKQIHPLTEIQPVTGVNWTRPYQHIYTNGVIDYVNQEFGLTIPKTIWKQNDADTDLDDLVTELVAAVGSQYTYSGGSKFLPVSWMENSSRGNDVIEGKYFIDRAGKKYHELLNIVTDPHYKDDWHRAWESGIHEPEIIFPGIRPFINLNKLDTLSITDKFGITAKLLDITRSCEWETPGTPMTDFSFHCGECHWCAERYMTFGRL